jgi:hypothetical protein
MKMTRTEELTLSLARGATGKVGDGQILTLIVVALLTGANLRAEVDLGLVLTAACLLGVLSVLERRQFYAIVQKLEQARDGAADRVADGQTA